MRKKYILIILTILIALFIAKLYNSICNSVGENLNTKEIKYGIIGRDTVLVIGNGKYQLMKTYDGINLIMRSEGDNLIEVVIADVDTEKCKEVNNKIYVIGSEGYAIVDENLNSCVAYITVDKQKFGGAYVTDDNGNTRYIPNRIIDDSFEYYDSYDRFTKEEQMIFNQSKENYKIIIE